MQEMQSQITQQMAPEEACADLARNTRMNVYTFVYLQGAIICLALAFLALSFVLTVLAYRRESILWRRNVRLYDSEKSAILALEAGELMLTEYDDEHLGHAFEAANKLGLLPRDLR